MDCFARSHDGIDVTANILPQSLNCKILLTLTDGAALIASYLSPTITARTGQWHSDNSSSARSCAVSIHTGAWRYPGAWPDANFNFARIKQLIQKLEAGKFDAFFMADHLAVLNMRSTRSSAAHGDVIRTVHAVSALAGATEHIG